MSKMQIFVKSLSSKTLALGVDSSDTVESVKKQIANENGGEFLS